ncbi:DUF4054 domain-containing protein [Candidatus Pacearchaeota archaeon]|nr:DUF4054 domain-containing protein [Candidatus Pacearchaeota archaeon]
MSCTVTVTEFKTLFDRGQFVFGTTVPDVRDKDIAEAISEMEAVINQDLIPDEDICKKAKLYLAAHFLVMDLDLFDNGGQGMFLQTHRSADGLSESLHIPEWMKETDFAMYTTTGYGIKFLMLTKPYLDGAVYCIEGKTQP